MSFARLYINNGIINKRVSEQELDQYLKDGWIRGMKKRSPEAREKANKKREATCLQKYGTKNVHQNTEIKDKTKQTCLERYSVDNAAKSDAVKEKTKKTNNEKWPENKNYHNLDKANATIINKYGSWDEFYKWRYEITDWEASVNKQIATKHEKHSFNISKPESNLYIELCKQYGEDNVLRNYNLDPRYPFMCDFYIKSDDLFIELNRHWTHGGHLFDKNSVEDQNTLNKWKEKAKTSSFYEYAIYNWTIRDLLKYNTAVKNNLNYKIIW